MKKIKVGILGATGMVGQRLVSLIAGHPWFEIAFLAASQNSAGKKYLDAVLNRWKIEPAVPEEVKNFVLKDVTGDINKYANSTRLVFSALNMVSEEIKNLENILAKKGLAVVSNNSAHRWTEYVPMVIPEINPDHLKLIDLQKEKNKSRGFIVVKPNCSHQSFLPVLAALKKFKPQKASITMLQAISGSGKTFSDWPEMTDNVIPFISGEEEKTEKEPLRILGDLKKNRIINAPTPVISSTCIRVPVTNGHMASVAIKFENRPSLKEIKKSIESFNSEVKAKDLPTSPTKFIHFFEDLDRPQTRLDRDLDGGMAVSVGRFREDSLYDWKFIGLSHNTLRGAAGGGVLTAELLLREGFL